MRIAAISTVAILFLLSVAANMVATNPDLLFAIEKQRSYISMDDKPGDPAREETYISKKWLDFEDPGLSEHTWKTIRMVSGPATTVMGLLTLTIGVVLLLKRKEVFAISNNYGGVLTIQYDSAVKMAEHTGLRNIHIKSCHCVIQRLSKKKTYPARVSITCYPKVEMGSSAVEVYEYLRNSIKHTMEETVGLNVDKIDVNIRYEKSKRR